MLLLLFDAGDVVDVAVEFCLNEVRGALELGKMSSRANRSKSTSYAPIIPIPFVVVVVVVAIAGGVGLILVLFCWVESKLFKALVELDGEEEIDEVVAGSLACVGDSLADAAALFAFVWCLLRVNARKLRDKNLPAVDDDDVVVGDDDDDESW